MYPSGFDDILKGISPTITKDMNAGLNHEYTADEVLQALYQMAPLIAPGPNGMSPIFYKSFYHIVGGDVTAAVLVALNLGIIPESINTTFISLIPKILNHKKVSDFRPISLYNAFYKLIANVTPRTQKGPKHEKHLKRTYRFFPLNNSIQINHIKYQYQELS